MISEAEARLLSIIAVTPECTRGKLVQVQQTLHPKESPWLVIAQVGWLIKLKLVDPGPELSLTDLGQRTLNKFKERWGAPADRFRSRSGRMT